MDEVDNEPAEFSIFWLVPEEDYIIEVEMGEDCTNSPEDPELEEPELEGAVSAGGLPAGAEVEVTLYSPL